MVAGFANTGVQKRVFFEMETEGSAVEDTGLASRDQEGLLAVHNSADCAGCDEGFPDWRVFRKYFRDLSNNTV